MHSIDGDYFPVVSPLPATYLHRNLIGTSSEPHWNLIGTSPYLCRKIPERTMTHRPMFISAYLCNRIIIEILLSLLVAPNIFGYSRL